MTNSPRYSADDLTSYAIALLEAAGLARERAQAVAEILVEGDLLGHTTHGLQLLGQYLKEIDGGNMALEGEPEVIREHGSALTWDGRRLPGPWLVLKAMDWAIAKA